MIAKGNLHGDGGGLARYLVSGDEHEIAELVETRGLENLGRDPVRAFEMLQKVAEANTRSTKPFFHAQTRNPDGDKQLTNAQWLQIADRLEKRLGLDNQPRIVSFHIDRATGEKHMHVAWCRIDLETMRAIDPGLYKSSLKQLCRALEKEYGLQEVSSQRKPEDTARIADRKEVEEARRLGMDVRAVRNAILDCLGRTDNGKAFRAALDERGLMLANGDRRDCFVVIDQAGGHHALNHKLTGMTLAALRDRLSDLDRTQLPGVEQAKAMQQEKHPTPEQAREAWDNRAGAEQGRQPEPERQQRDAKPEAKHPGYAPEPETRLRQEATARQEAAKEQERPAATDRAGQGDRWQERPATKMEEKIFRILDGSERGGASVSAGLHTEGITLARVDAAGKANVDNEYRHRFENDKLQDIRQGTNEARLRRTTFKEGELVAVNKWGDVYRLNPRFLDLDKLERAATGGRTPTLSAAQEHFATEWQRQKSDRAAARETKQAQRDRAEFAQGVGQGAKDGLNPASSAGQAIGRGAKEAWHDLKGSRTGFKVVDAKGMVTSLSSFVESLFGMGAAPHGPGRQQDGQQHAPQGGGGNAYEAMEEIYERSQRGEDLSAESIRNLPAAHLQNLHRHGDAYMHGLIREFEREREQEAARSWAEYDHDRMGRER